MAIGVYTQTVSEGVRAHYGGGRQTRSRISIASGLEGGGSAAGELGHQFSLALSLRLSVSLDYFIYLYRARTEKAAAARDYRVRPS